MAFQARKFEAAKWQPRTAKVKLAALADWFDEGDEPEFEVRGLTATEVAKSNEVTDQSDKIKAVIEALTTKNQSKQKEAFRNIFGFGDDTPSDIMKRVMMIEMGSVNPKLEQSTVVKLAEVAPIEFYQLSNKITELTGLGGMVEGKSPPSGKTRGRASRAS